MKCKYCDYINPDSAEKCACCGNTLGEKELPEESLFFDLPEDESALDFADDMPPDNTDKPERTERKKALAKKKKRTVKGYKKRLLVCVVAVVLCLSAVLPCLLLFKKPKSEEAPSSPPIPVYLPKEDRFRFVLEGNLVDGYIKGYNGNIGEPLLTSDDKRLSLFCHSYKKGNASLSDYYLVTADGIRKIEKRSYTYAALVCDGEVAFLLTSQEKAFIFDMSKKDETELPYEMLYAKAYPEYDCILYAGENQDVSLSINRLDTSDFSSAAVCERASYAHSFTELFDNAILFKEYGTTETQFYRVDKNEITYTLDGEFPQILCLPSGTDACVTVKKNEEYKTYIYNPENGIPSYLCDNFEPITINDGGDLLYGTRVSDDYLIQVRILESDAVVMVTLAPYSKNYTVFTQNGESVLYPDKKYFYTCHKNGVPMKVGNITTLLGFSPQKIGDTVSSFVGMPIVSPSDSLNVYYMNDEHNIVKIPSHKYELRFLDINVNNPGVFFYTAEEKIWVIREGVGEIEEFASVNTDNIKNMYIINGGKGLYWLSGSTLMYSDGTKEGTKTIAEDVTATDFAHNTLCYRIHSDIANTATGVVEESCWYYTKNGTDGRKILDGKATDIAVYDSCIYVTRISDSDYDGDPTYDIYAGKSFDRLKIIVKNTQKRSYPQ